MKSVVQKWGNSLALRIPKAMAEHIKVREGAPVEITGEKGGLWIRTSKTKKTLKELLANVTPENLHGETQTGHVVGKEIW